ncbi:MAG TPA: 23S rRNA (pseudouridine(1915)-N(3))-methyltransferase RlmH [Rhodospirillaceae bacterium]|nr:23S rRNA (pseudouridine(1915)-N(3))-methyltransferase RlmH [Rhodospirillaceae bacterium]
MRLALHAIGRLRGAEAELAADYAKRLQGTFQIRELSGKTAKAEGAALLKALPDKALVVLLDERGQDISSCALAKKMQAWQESGPQDLVFLIGGADGVTEEVRGRADFILAFGRKTWPHKLVRVMLLEQLYRIQQINAGHPYHRSG